MNLGKRLINIRKKNKMSQEDFSEIFNVTRQTISNWENSKSYPDIETMVKISDYHIEYNKLFKYPIASIGTHGATTEKERNVNKKLQNMPNFNNIQEHIDYVKKLYEDEGMTILVAYLKDWNEYSEKYMKFYEIINN